MNKIVEFGLYLDISADPTQKSIELTVVYRNEYEADYDDLPRVCISRGYNNAHKVTLLLDSDEYYKMHR